jgi:hypothetical protein
VEKGVFQGADDERQYLLDDYDSEDESVAKRAPNLTSTGGEELSTATFDLLNKYPPSPIMIIRA